MTALGWKKRLRFTCLPLYVVRKGSGVCGDYNTWPGHRCMYRSSTLAQMYHKQAVMSGFDLEYSRQFLVSKHCSVIFFFTYQYRSTVMFSEHLLGESSPKRIYGWS